MINLLVGILTGIAASMGLGGGFVLLVYLAVFTQTTQLGAQGINLLFFLPIAVISVIIHARNKLIVWRVLPLMCAAGVVGVGGGYLLSLLLDEKWLSKAFAGLLLVVGIRETFGKVKSEK